MKLNQISVFLQNKPGQLKAACQVLASAGINILTLSLADTQQFGILRLLVREWEQAKQLFEQNDWVVNVAEVLALEVTDRPGGLVEVLTIIETIGINIEYMYAFAFGREDKAILIFRFEDPDRAISLLQAQGINLIKSVDLDSRR